MKRSKFLNHHVSRRDFVKSLGAAGLCGLGLPKLTAAVWGAGQNGSSAPIFEEVPASASGITWVHDNAMSAQRYLPETLGPGCAFFDYDNDGWMDIYLV